MFYFKYQKKNGARNGSMASSLSQSPFFSSLVPINRTAPFSHQSKNFSLFKSSKIFSLNSETSPNSRENEPESQTPGQDPIKIAFAKANAYKKWIQSETPISISVQNLVEEPYTEVSGENSDESKSDDGLEYGGVSKEVPLAVKLAMEKAKEYKKGKSLEESGPTSSNVAQNLAIDSAEKNEELRSVEVKSDSQEKEVPLAVKLALEKAKEYKKNNGAVGSNSYGDVGSETSGLKGENTKGYGDKLSGRNADSKQELTISSIDFVGLNFSDKRSGRDLPAGLVPLSDPFPEGELPEVEILVGDTSKFGNGAPNPIALEEDDDEFYKPKVSTWGVFPRPSNISETYGGGRNIRPGEALETAEERAAKQACTRQMIAAYRSKIGLNIDPKLKSECEKALKDGDSLMDLGKLKEALPYYEEVMEKLVFQSELHGLAALQWSICQDSLSRPDEARVMYEKLQSHPSPKVSKRARQFVFGFQAMEMMKVTSMSRSPLSTGYQNYFEAFVKDKINYQSPEAEVDEGALSQALPYVIFLVSPIFMVLLIAASRFQ